MLQLLGNAENILAALKMTADVFCQKHLLMTIEILLEDALDIAGEMDTNSLESNTDGNASAVTK